MGAIFSTTTPSTAQDASDQTKVNNSRRVSASLVTQDGTRRLKCYYEDEAQQEAAPTSDGERKDGQSGGGKKKRVKKTKARKVKKTKKNKKNIRPRK